MATNAGKVFMEFDDGTSGWIPSRNVRAAIKDGGKVANRTAMGQVTPRQMAASWLNHASTAGGVAGGIVGGIGGGAIGGPPGAMAGRVSGGAVGGYLGQQAAEAGYGAMGLGDAPGTPNEALVSNAAAGVLGEGLAGAFGLGGRALIRTGLPARLHESGRVVGNMVKERIPVGGFSKLNKLGSTLGRGSDKARAIMGSRTATRNAVNADASRQGVMIPRAVAEDAIKGLITKTGSEMGDDAEVMFLKRKLAQWRAKKLDMLPPSEVQPIISRFDARSKAVFNAIAKGAEPVKSGMQARASYQRDVADALRKAMHETVPGHKETSRALGTAIATKNAVSQAENAGMRSLGSRFATGAALTSVGEMATGHDPRNRMGLGAATGGALLASPALLSRGGLALTNPALLAFLRHAPRFATGPKEGK